MLCAIAVGTAAVIWYVHSSQKTSQQAMHRAVIVDKQNIKQRIAQQHTLPTDPSPQR